ncbi:hypothetical protein [Candidatus Electronema sp. PJ]
MKQPDAHWNYGNSSVHQANYGVLFGKKIYSGAYLDRSQTKKNRKGTN